MVIPEHQVMDEILKYLIDNKTDRLIHCRTIWKKLYPEQEKELIYILLKKIINTHDPIVVSIIINDNIHDFDVEFQATAITKMYLAQGGFSKSFEKTQIEEAEFSRVENLNKQKLESEVDVILFQKGSGKKLIIWGFIIAVLSFFFSIFSSLNSNYKSNLDNSTIDSLKTRLNVIEKELLIIKAQSKKESKK